MAKGLFKEYSQELTPQEIIEGAQVTSIITLQKWAIIFLFFAFGGSLLASMTIFFLQGFGAWGFQLDNAILKWLGIATIGQVAGLASLVYGALFKKR